MAKGILVLLCCCFCVIQVVAENQENFYPFGRDTGDDYLRRDNDVASPAIDLRFGMPFYNKKYWKIFVNDNGVLSFENAYTRYDGPQPVFPVGPDLDFSTDQERILIAPFWGNVDTSDGDGYVYYRQTTEQDLLDKASADIHRGFVEWDDFQAKVLIIATWRDVGFYGMAYGYGIRNSFQCIVATDGFETFAIFIYDRIDWTTGTESYGGAENGIGGFPAQVGFNAGDGSKSFSHLYSRDHPFLRNLVTESNIESAGVWVYYISSVSVDIAGCTTAGEVKTFPRYDSMLGHQYLYIQGPCFTPEDDIWMQFGPVDDPIALIDCTWISTQRAWCVVPTFFQVGRLETRVSRNGANDTFLYTGVFDVVDIGDVPPGINRINPQSESWMLTNRTVAIEWDPSLFNYSQIDIDILTYSERDGEPSWEETANIGLNAENTGRFEWIPRASAGITPDSAIGVIRITRPNERSLFAIWSDVHWLGYMLNEEFQRAPSDYSNQQCEIWNEQINNEPVWDHDKDLNPCPCDLSQALADRARFRPYALCDMSNAGLNDTEDYCFLRDGIRHCVINIINSPQNADSVCCYDYEENLVYAGDSFSGSFSHRWTVNGVPPYNAPRAVPELSTLINDIVPYYFCCVWGDRCEFYQDHRPTRDCRWYDSPRMAALFGDPHFVTFDGVEYSFNGKGEWFLMRSVTGARNGFTLQARTEQMPDWKGDIIQATRVTSVAMKEDNHANIEVQLSSRSILQVVYQGEYLKIDRQTRLPLDGFYLTFPKQYEGGNLTQVIITFQDSKIAVVINGTAEGMFIQVIIPNEFKGYVEGLLGNWDEKPDNDLTNKNGMLINRNASAEVIYDQFGKSWEISPAESLFLYDQGQNHEYFQDNDFVPAFLPPDGNLPTDLDSQVIADTCDGNLFCIYDIQSSGLLQLGKATKKAYDDYTQAQRSLQGKLFITPTRGGILGGELIYLYGPSWSLGLLQTCVFTYGNEIIQTVTATVIDTNEAYCVPDPFFLVGEVSITVVKEGQSIADSPSTTYSLIESGRVDPTVTRQNSDSSIWDTTGNTLTITWTEDEENFGSSNGALTISVLAYREDGTQGPRWEEVYVISDGTADNGSYTFTPIAQSDVTADNAFGVIRITGNATGRQRVLWSDIHPLGYMLEQSYQDDPVQWASDKCQQWIIFDDSRSENFLENLPPCPCTLDQAEQDVGTFITDPTCYPGGGNATCSKNEGAIHCFLSAYASPPVMSGTKCCYDSNGLLMHSGDTKYAGMSGLSHVRGSSPYMERNLVPELSHWTNDIIAKYFCYEWSPEEKCFEYVKRRPTTDCVEYEPPSIALSFGDPHFITMDGYNFTFNGLGEYTMLRYATSGTKTGAFDFELQGRQVWSMDQAGNRVDVTQLSAVAMKDISSDTIFIEPSTNSGHGGMVIYRKSIGEADMWQSISFSQTFTDLRGCAVDVTQFEGDFEIHGVVVMFRETGIGVHVTYDYGMLAVRPILPSTLDSNYLSGLLGNMDGDPSNDLQRRDSNITLENPNDEEIFQFGQSWEIESGYNLFRYAGSEHSDYHDTSFVPLMNVALPTNYPGCNFVTQCLFDYEVSNHDDDLAMATLGVFEAFESSSENIQKIDACPYLITPLTGFKTYTSDANKYFEGAQVTFSCDDAILVGSPFRTCVYSKQQEGLVWTGSEGENECFVSPCGILDTPTNGFIILSDDRLTATFACEEGFTMNGPSASVCQEEEWTNGSPKCTANQPVDPDDNKALIIALSVVFSVLFIVLVVVGAFFFNRYRQNGSFKTEKRELTKEAEINEGMEMNSPVYSTT